MSLALLCTNLSAQQVNTSDSLIAISEIPEFAIASTQSLVSLKPPNTNFTQFPYSSKLKIDLSNPSLESQRSLLLGQSDNGSSKKYNLNLRLDDEKKNFFLDNRRNRYSSLWAFASLNYVYADLVGIMDKNILVQYQNGVVNGLKITPQFLALGAAYMQIPLVNVFLPQVIKNERTLRWVQIASGAFMTLAQSGTLFIGKPTPYYVLFSMLEIAATTYITIDAIKWKAKSNKKKILVD
ncbi:DUF6326 family protein [Flavobacterium sp.]|uniref:DUF6326 family protein n=1 Tax=Flavobacterium sp. TaxID=239 RepID=UPI00286E8437|nr:DUF6326 family protein [Flavobacterium sp.]